MTDIMQRVMRKHIANATDEIKLRFADETRPQVWLCSVAMVSQKGMAKRYFEPKGIFSREKIIPAD